MKKSRLLFWILTGCILLAVALVIGIGYQKMAKGEKQANNDIQEVNFVENFQDTDIGEPDITEEIPDSDEMYGGDENLENEENRDDGFYNGDIVLETEYDIKDYCEGCFIVSKNNDLLYGLLDMQGNEILPVEFDEMRFCNAENVRNGKHETIYIKTKYEEQYRIWDSDGNLFFDGDLSAVDYEYGTPDADSAFWYYNNSTEKVCRIYKEDATLLREIDFSDCNDGSYVDLKWGSPENYFVTINNATRKSSYSVYIDSDVCLYDKNANVKMEWEHAQLVNGSYKTTDSDEYYFYLVHSGSIYEKYSVSDGGDINLLGTMDQHEVNEDINGMRTQKTKNEWYLGKDKNVILSYSNNTYKLQDENGNALYDERYYEGYRVNGCYVLTNEDSLACLINQNGKLVIDYGWIVVKNEHIYFAEKGITEDSFLVGKDEVGIVNKENGISRVYMFSAVDF